jgi:hypothetical protein
MLDAFLIILPHPTPELRFANHLADIFKDKLVRIQIDLCPQTKSLLLGLDDGNWRVLLLLESLVATVGSTSTITYALDLGRTIDAVGIFATC